MPSRVVIFVVAEPKLASIAEIWTLAAVILARNALMAESCVAALLCRVVMLVVAEPKLASMVEIRLLA